MMIACFVDEYPNMWQVLDAYPSFLGSSYE